MGYTKFMNGMYQNNECHILYFLFEFTETKTWPVYMFVKLRQILDTSFSQQSIE
jgi:hypothetical protein